MDFVWKGTESHPKIFIGKHTYFIICIFPSEQSSQLKEEVTLTWARIKSTGREEELIQRGPSQQLSSYKRSAIYILGFSAMLRCCPEAGALLGQGGGGRGGGGGYRQSGKE